MGLRPGRRWVRPPKNRVVCGAVTVGGTGRRDKNAGYCNSYGDVRCREEYGG